MKQKALSIMLLVMLVSAVACIASTSRRVPPTDDMWWRVSPTQPIIQYMDHLRVEKSQRHGNLALFPVSVSAVEIPDIHLTLTQAVKQGLFEISELDDSDVNRLRVRNRAKEPVFIMAGEMLRGGKQDRIAGDDLIVPARSKLTIPVFCVEHGRWAGRSHDFSVGHSLAGAKTRAVAGRGVVQGGGQGAVWSSVAEQQEALGTPSETGALRSVHDSELVRDQMKPFLRALSDLSDEHPKAVGIVAVVGDEIIAADLFSSRELFEQMWPDLLEAYVIDALERQESDVVVERHGDKTIVRGGVVKEHAGYGSAIDEKKVLRWLNGLRSTNMSPKNTPGDGDLYDLNGRDVTGAALIYERGVVHIALFPKLAVTRPDYNSLEFRRERLR